MHSGIHDLSPKRSLAESVSHIFISGLLGLALSGAGSLFAAQEAPLETPVQNLAARRRPLEVEVLGERARSLIELGSLKNVTSGFSSSTIKVRSTSDNDDIDFYQTLGFDVNPNGKTSFNFLGRVAVDLDGDRDQQGYYIFDSISDSRNKQVDERLISASLSHDFSGWIDQGKLGRQSIAGTPEYLHLDGFSLKSASLGSAGLVLGIYGGIPVRYFESAKNDTLMGATAECAPWTSGRFRADWIHARDAQASTAVQKNDLYSVKYSQNLMADLLMQTFFSAIDEEERDCSLQLWYQNSALDLDLSAKLYVLLNTQGNDALEFNPFFSSLREIYPYHTFSLIGSKGIGENVVLDLGMDIRKVRKDINEGSFNRNYERYFLTASVDDLLWENGSLSLTVDRWGSNSRSITGISGDISHQCNEKLTASAGSSFSLYKYDYYTDSERNEVKDYYLSCEYDLKKGQRLRLSYDYEDDEQGSAHVVKAGMTCKF